MVRPGKRQDNGRRNGGEDQAPQSAPAIAVTLRHGRNRFHHLSR
jgi:hypothetical protein